MCCSAYEFRKQTQAVGMFFRGRLQMDAKTWDSARAIVLLHCIMPVPPTSGAQDKQEDEKGWRGERRTTGGLEVKGAQLKDPGNKDTNQGVHGRETTLQNREWTWKILSLASENTRKTERDDQLWYFLASNMGKARGHEYHTEATQEAQDLWWKRDWAKTNENLSLPFK